MWGSLVRNISYNSPKSWNTKFWRRRRQCETLAGNAHLFMYAPFWTLFFFCNCLVTICTHAGASVRQVIGSIAYGLQENLKNSVQKGAYINKWALPASVSHCLLLLLLYVQITRSDLHWCMCRDIHICAFEGLEFNWEGCSTAGAKSRCSRKH
jgi:hypothetical protein